MRAEKQMVSVDAASLVATVTDVQTNRDRAVLDGPRQSMSEVLTTLHGNAAVAPFVHAAVPNQAA